MKDVIAQFEALNNVYLITHSYGEVIDGITYDEE